MHFSEITDRGGPSRSLSPRASHLAGGKADLLVGASGWALSAHMALACLLPGGASGWARDQTSVGGTWLATGLGLGRILGLRF